jgi:hypothetical protein
MTVISSRDPTFAASNPPRAALTGRVPIHSWHRPPDAPYLDFNDTD